MQTIIKILMIINDNIFILCELKKLINVYNIYYIQVQNCIFREVH